MVTVDEHDRLEQFARLVLSMRSAQRDYFAHGRTTVAEAKRLEQAVDRWLTEHGFTTQQTLFAEKRR